MSTQHPNLSHVTPDQHHPKLHHANHQTGGSDVVTVTEAELSFTDVTTADASTSKHGLVKKLPNDATKYYDGTGNYSTPSGGGGGSSPILTADVQLTNADIKALLTSPFELLPAPGVGLFLALHGLYWVFDTSGGAYTTADDEILVVGYGVSPADLNENSLMSTANAGGNLCGGAGVFLVPPNCSGNIPDTSGLLTGAGEGDNQPLAVAKRNGVQEFGGGNAANTLSIRVFYSLVPAVPFGA